MKKNKNDLQGIGNRSYLCEYLQIFNGIMIELCPFYTKSLKFFKNVVKYRCFF